MLKLPSIALFSIGRQVVVSRSAACLFVHAHGNAPARRCVCPACVANGAARPMWTSAACMQHGPQNVQLVAQRCPSLLACMYLGEGGAAASIGLLRVGGLLGGCWWVGGLGWAGRFAGGTIAVHLCVQLVCGRARLGVLGATASRRRLATRTYVYVCVSVPECARGCVSVCISQLVGVSGATHARPAHHHESAVRGACGQAGRGTAPGHRCSTVWGGALHVWWW